jgi:hypothetical protein
MTAELDKKIIALHKQGLTPEQIEKKLDDGKDESTGYFLQKHSIEFVIKMGGA